MRSILIVTLTTLLALQCLEKAYATSPIDIIGEAHTFDVVIDTAYVTKLDNDPIVQEVVQGRYSEGASQRLSKSLDGSVTEAPSHMASDVPTLRYLDDDSVATLASNTSCGFCKARLLWGEEGVIESPNFPNPYGPNMDCLWLLMAADEDARIQLVCDTIKLEPCGSQNGFAPSWRDFLIVSPLWNFKKSWVYCGHATTLTSIKHTSVCNQMAVTFRSNQNNRNNIGFHCTYKVI